MYVSVSLLVALASQVVVGGPIYFPDEVKMDKDGKGFMVLPGVYIHRPDNKSVPAMLSFGVTQVDDQLSLVMNLSAKTESVKNIEESKSEPSTMMLSDKNIQQTDNVTNKIDSEMLASTIEKNNNHLNVHLSNENLQNSNNITSEIDSETGEYNEGNINSVLSIESEESDNDATNNKTEEIDLEIRSMSMKVDDKSDDLKTKNPPKIKSNGKSMKLKYDSSSPLPSEDVEKIILFGDEKDKPADKIFMFPTTKSPIHNDSMEKSEKNQNSPTLNPCPEGDILYKGNCAQILSSYHCPKDQWLVMKGPDFAECEPRPCPFGQILYQNECVSPDNSSICSKGQMLYVEMTGEAFCDCDPDYIYLLRDGTCVPEYEQGSCDWGKYLVRNENGVPECVTNPCGRDGSVYHEENKMCYNKNYVGFCEQEQLEIKGNQAECMEIFQVLALRNVFEVPTLRRCPRGSLRDLLHECRRRYNMPSMPSILKAKHFHGGCPPGWMKASRGRCKKIVDLFSSPK